MTGLLLATPQEALPFINGLHAQKVGDEPYETYRFADHPQWKGGFLVISGMGKAAARSAATWLVKDAGVNRVVNLGVCGSLREGIVPFDIFRIQEVTDGDIPGLRLSLPENEKIWTGLRNANLVSVDHPVFDPKRRQILSQSSHVVDMEGSAVAEVCERNGVDCQLLKGVTDLADTKGKKAIQENIHGVSQKLADMFLRMSPTDTFLKRLHRFTRAEHTIFSLPLLFAGAWIGSNHQLPSLRLLALIAMAGLGARTMGMALNRILDRKFDRLNPRTANRELPSGKMSVGTAYAIAVIGIAVYLLACAGLGPLCLMLSPIPLIPLATYSLLKRFTSLCHFGIGICLAMAPLGAYVAASGSIVPDWEILLLAVFTFCWISGFDIIYALQDIDFDRKTRVHSLPAALGAKRAEMVAALAHVLAAMTAFWLWSSHGGIISGIFLTVTIGALAAGYWRRIPLPTRFFPVSAVASIAASFIVMSGGLP